MSDNIIEKLDAVLEESVEKDTYDGVAVLKRMFQDGDFKEFVHHNGETKRIEIILGWRKWNLTVGDIVIRQFIVNGNIYCSKDTITKINPKSYITRSGTNLIRQSYYVIDESMTKHIHLSPVEITT